MVHVLDAVVDGLGRCDSANAGRVLGKSQSTLSNWRVAGIGPRWFKNNGRVYYNYADLVDYGRGEQEGEEPARGQRLAAIQPQWSQGHRLGRA